MFTSVVGPKGSSKTPLLILHGLFGSQRNWQTMAQAIAQKGGHLVISADLPNHGQSVLYDPHTRMPVGEEMTWPLMTRHVSNLIQNEIGRPVRILGHSLGGLIAMKTAETMGDLIEDMVIVDIEPRPLPFASSQQEKYLLKMIEINRASLAKSLSRKEALTLFKQVEPNDVITQFILTNFSDRLGAFALPLESLHRGMLHLSTTFSIESGLKTPTHFIKGERSDYIKDEGGLLGKVFPNHRLSIIKDTGHWPHYEKPTEFLSLIVNNK